VLRLSRPVNASHHRTAETMEMLVMGDGWHWQVLLTCQPDGSSITQADLKAHQVRPARQPVMSTRLARPLNLCVKYTL